MPAKPGAARQYLMNTYSPISDRDLKMGHVFLILMEQDKSVARTVRAVNEVFPCIIRPNDMKSVLNTLNSFKHLGREKEMQDFVQCCSEPFTLYTPNSDTEYCKSAEASNSIRMDLDSDQLLLSVTSPKSSVKHIEPMPSASNDPSINLLSVRSVKNMTPRYVSSVKSLKGLINRQRINKIKYLNQEINRKTARLAVKEATITKLRQQLKQGKEVQVTSAMMGDSNLKQRTLKRLRDSNKIKRKLKYVDTVSLDKFASLQLKLTAKDDVITMLKDRVLVLEEEIEELKEATDKTKCIRQ